MVVVIVEPALADRDDLGLREQRFDAVDAAAGLVRVHAGGGPHAGVGTGDGDRRPRVLQVTADGDHALDAGDVGRLHRVRDVTGVRASRKWR